MGQADRDHDKNRSAGANHGPGDRSTGTGNDFNPRNMRGNDNESEKEESRPPAFGGWGNPLGDMDFESGAFRGPDTRGLEGSFSGPDTTGLEGSFRGGAFGEHEDLDAQKERRTGWDKAKAAFASFIGDSEEKAREERHNQWARNVEQHLRSEGTESEISEFDSANTLQTAIDAFASLVTLGTRIPGITTAADMFGSRSQGEDESDAAFAGRTLANESGMNGLVGMGLGIGGAYAGVNPDAIKMGGILGDTVAKDHTIGESTPGHDPHSSGNGPRDRSSTDVSVSSAPVDLDEVIKLFASLQTEPEPEPFALPDLQAHRLGRKV